MNPIFEPIPITKSSVSLPRRASETHKTHYGRVLILGGSVGYAGAPSFASRAAVRVGAGLVFLYVPEQIYTVSAIKNDEAMVFPLPGNAAGQLNTQGLPSILDRLQTTSVCLIGPGLGQNPDIDTIIYTILKNASCPIVLDADGINAISRNIDILRQTTHSVTLTPHDGEFARLGGIRPGETRVEAARRFAVEYRCNLVLKGHRTLIAFPDGSVYQNTTGNPGMAKGGSGDVLAGTIAGLIGQPIPPEDAVRIGVFLHSFAGDLCAERLGEYGMTPSDIINTLPEASKLLTR